MSRMMSPWIRAANARGVAGTLLVRKAAVCTPGRASLQDVAKAARDAAERVKTMGAAYEVCTLPGRPPLGRLGAGEVELGLGIHGSRRRKNGHADGFSVSGDARGADHGDAAAATSR